MAAKTQPTEHKGYGLLIASVVAIVAIVGLVMLFRGGASGNLVAVSSEGTTYASGVGEAYMRGDRYGFQPGTANGGCGDGSVAYYDFNGNVQGCKPTSTDQGLAGRFYTSYSGGYTEPKGYRDVNGGMYTQEEGFTDSPNGGAPPKMAREGVERYTLPTSRTGSNGQDIVLG